MDDIKAFEDDCRREIEAMGDNVQLRALTMDWLTAVNEARYSYHFRAFGLPIIQYPQDIVAVQEIVWAVRPTLIIETGVARGGSLVWSAGLLALLDYTDAMEDRIDLRQSNRRVLGIDIDIRSHNKAAIDAHPLRGKIRMIQGSSIDPEVVKAVAAEVRPDDRVLVILDSNHTHDHVLAELDAYAPLVSPGSYCVVFDTVIEDLPKDSFGSRPWNVGNSPKTAVASYLQALAARPQSDASPAFDVDTAIEHKLLITVAPGGFLRRRDA